jgi:NAD(P)-dependent dehydrogenase (short-subunit alcohol dehydrogenase family)
MAKAGLNMLTRTTAAELAAEGIFVNAVDPGWISRENPLPTRADLRSRGDVPPLDAADAAARVCDPIHRARAGHPVWGQLWKDFEPTEW